MDTSTSQDSYLIQGKEVKLPVQVRDASTFFATYWVPSKAVKELTRETGLQILEPFPGRTICTIAAIDYKDNDLGDYNEVAIAFPVTERPVAPIVGALLATRRGEFGTYIHHLPVNQGFTCEAGREIWGFPKTVQEIEFREENGNSLCDLTMDGKHVLTLSVKQRRGGKDVKDVELLAYSFGSGHVIRVPWINQLHGATGGLGGSTLELGDHPIADELRSLGLPKRALMSGHVQRMEALFAAPQAV